ncbi:MAG: hypothetical protein CMP94_05210 [Gammaproteobacteria bacterium]|nr:hypothetical protein [Gammaproteobacteria bacterium]
MSITLLLLRHGQIKANRQGRWHGSTDSPLTLKGRIQASLTARALAQSHNITAAYTSPLQRCIHTGGLATARLPITPSVIDGLAEMSVGDWEGEKYSRLQSEHQLIDHCTGDIQWRPPNGESLADVAQRMSDSIAQITQAHKQGTVLVVSHGAATAIAIATLLHDDPSRWGDYHFRNCSLTELTLQEEATLGRFNDCSHLGLFG